MPEPGPRIWEWLRKGQLSKNISSKQAALTLDDDDEVVYGNRYDYDTSPADRDETFQGRGFFWSEVQALIDAMGTPSAVATITDLHDRIWEGLVRSLQWEQIAGTRRWDCTLVLRNPTRTDSVTDADESDSIGGPPA